MECRPNDYVAIRALANCFAGLAKNNTQPLEFIQLQRILLANAISVYSTTAKPTNDISMRGHELQMAKMTAQLEAVTSLEVTSMNDTRLTLEFILDVQIREWLLIHLSGSTNSQVDIEEEDALLQL